MQKIIRARYDKDKEYVYALKFYDNIFLYLKKNISKEYSFELCTPKELINFLKGKRYLKKDVVSINKRSKGCVVFSDKVIASKSLSEANKNLKKLGLYLPKEEKVLLQNIIKGQVAFKGRRVGKVKLLYSKKDMAKVKKGDIIVSPMTVSYFEPALIKAAAIVTDEGGITVHAAIFSREFRIPCIVGTKIATKVLKDGDLVEVDADKGVVKILKRK